MRNIEIDITKLKREKKRKEREGAFLFSSAFLYRSAGSFMDFPFQLIKSRVLSLRK